MYSNNFKHNFIRELNEHCQNGLNSILLLFEPIESFQRESFIDLRSIKLLECSTILTDDFQKSIESLENFKENILNGLRYALNTENLYRSGLTVNTYVISSFGVSLGGKKLSIEIYLKNVEESV